MTRRSRRSNKRNVTGESPTCGLTSITAHNTAHSHSYDSAEIGSSLAVGTIVSKQSTVHTDAYFRHRQVAMLDSGISHSPVLA
ncbi:hypothetical protein E2C01_095141 [Portunus trituberculatus]|uniref:Uncharacterized protein n=1 Tax=Portunus trituberculatus TaxID=210409 RepID=A0A5B7JP26_PORTR|nr:hypothetical protein [Portunus trituberculatus]